MRQEDISATVNGKAVDLVHTEVEIKNDIWQGYDDSGLHVIAHEPFLGAKITQRASDRATISFLYDVPPFNADITAEINGTRYSQLIDIRAETMTGGRFMVHAVLDAPPNEKRPAG